MFVKITTQSKMSTNTSIFSMKPLRPRRYQETVFYIENFRHLSVHPPDSIRSQFLPGYFCHPLAKERVNYHIEYGGG